MPNNFPQGAPQSFGGVSLTRLGDTTGVLLAAGGEFSGAPTAARAYTLPLLASCRSGAPVSVTNTGSADITVTASGTDQVNEAGAPGAFIVLPGTTAIFECKNAVGAVAGSWFVSRSAPELLSPFFFGIRGSSQTADIGVNDNVIFQFNDGSRGSSIALNGTTGIFTLQPFKRYKLTADLGEMDFSGTTGRAEAKWFNITTASLKGRSAMAFDNQNTATAGSANSALATFSPAAVQEVELRILVATAVTGFGTTAVPCMAFIEEI